MKVQNKENSAIKESEKLLRCAIKIERFEEFLGSKQFITYKCNPFLF